MDLRPMVAMLSPDASSGSANNSFRGLADWFGPLQPMNPIAPEEVRGRAYDYPMGVNLQTTPKVADGDSIDYPTLRRLSRNCDILRSIIESWKDRFVKYEFRIIDLDKGPKAQSKRAIEAQKLLRRPDGRTPFHAMQRTILEDCAVIDAASLWVDLDGEQIGKGSIKVPPVRVMDGATINVRLDKWGRIPVVPADVPLNGKDEIDWCAYQQILKGMPANNYTTREILWMPRNRSSDRIFGYSPVEQGARTISMALRRTAMQMDFFTKGNIPEMLVACPDSWLPSDIKEAQENWEAWLNGRGARGTMRFIPGGMKPELYKTDVVKSEFDEWLARIFSHLFSMPPTPFIKEVTRNNGQTMQETAIQEGVLPFLRYLADCWNLVIQDAWGLDDLEFSWNLDTDPDAATLVSMVQVGMISAHAAGLRMGLHEDEIPEEIEPQEQSPGAPGKAEPGSQAPAKDIKPGKDDVVAHGSTAVKKADIDEKPGEAEDGLFANLETYLSQLLKPAQTEADRLFAHGLEMADEPLPKPSPQIIRGIRVALHGGAVEGAEEVKAEVLGVHPASVVSSPALDYAEKRAAEMIGMKLDAEGNLIENPDAAWQVTDMVRQAIRKTVAEGLEKNWTPQQLAEVLRTDFAFSRVRARNIARTEIINAKGAGALEYLKANGNKTKRWSEQDGCEVCTENADAGEIGIYEAFPSGHQAPGAHPGCRCRLLPGRRVNV